MAIEPRPTADIDIDAAMVRALLQSQHADLAHLTLTELHEGWDNRLFRLGDNLAVRLPRRAAAAALIEHEQRWLPHLGTRLPLPVPVPQRVGRPDCGFPWSWSVSSWFPGRPALLTPPRDDERAARALGEFLRALHQPAPEDAPSNPWRSVALARRTEALHQHVRQLERSVDAQQVHRSWECALTAAEWLGPPSWIHGDLHPGNLIVDDDRLSAVIDFGDLAAGDPAVDLSAAWMLFPRTARRIFLDSARNAFNPIDQDMVNRARGWALALGLAFMARSADDFALAALGRATVGAVLNDDSD